MDDWDPLERWAMPESAFARSIEMLLSSHLDLDDHTLGHRCEQVIRNYDPCISCATHFLRFDLDRGQVPEVSR